MTIPLTALYRSRFALLILVILTLGFSRNVLAQSGINVALASNGGVATASSTFNASFPASAVNNGDRKGVNWGSGGGWNDATSASYPDWVQIDFSAAQTINEVDVFTLQDNWSAPTTPSLSTLFSQYGVADFQVQYWTGSVWTTVPNGSVTANRNVWRQFTFANITTSKIRVLVTNALGGYSRITEVEAYAPSVSSGTNVALASNGGVATASSSYSASYPVAAVNNGDRKGVNWGNGGGWNDGTVNAYSDWVQVDFSSSNAISEIDVFTIQDNPASPITPTLSTQFSQYGITDFQVQYWTGTAWADVPNGNVTGNRNVWRQFTFTSITTSKIRVVVNNAMAGYSRIAEIEAYSGSGSGSTSPGLNVAHVLNGGVAIASSTYSSGDGTVASVYSSSIFPVTAVNNGDRKGLNWGGGGGWNSANSFGFPDWVQIAFSSTQTISEIDVFTIQDNFTNPSTPTATMQFSQYGITDFQVQYWTGSAWADVPNGNVTGNRNVWRQFTFANITTSKIRVLVNGGLGGYSRIAEIEAYQAPGFTTAAPAPSPTPSTGVWIAPRTDGQNGTGTLTDPYNGSTAAKIVTAINDLIPANTVVHFAPGTYSVSNIAPKAGMKILGAGKDVTVFVWDGSPQTAMILGYNSRSDILVSDLTLNGRQDVRPSPPMAINAVDCNNFTVRNVRVTNFRGGTSSEAFPLAIFCDRTTVTGGLIEYCELDHCYRGTPDASSIGATLLSFGHGGSGDPTTRVSGTIQYNFIHDCPHVQGIGGGGTNSVYQGNVIVNCDTGWYRDVYLASGPQVINNHFLNCKSFGVVASSNASGVDDPASACDGLIIANNTITMDPTISEPIAGVLTVGSYVTNTQVYGNSVDKNTATYIQFGFNIATPGSTVYSNTASPGFTNVPWF